MSPFVYVPGPGGEAVNVDAGIQIDSPNDPGYGKYEQHHEGHACPKLEGDKRKHAKSVSNTPHTEEEEDCEEAESLDHLVFTKNTKKQPLHDRVFTIGTSAAKL